MNGAQIIAKFELYVDDNSELSSTEELDLLNKILDDVYTDRPWEFLKLNATGTATTTAGVTSIPLPTGFRYVLINYQMTNNSDDTDIDQAKKVVYMGSKLTPYTVVNYSDRRRYLNMQGYCYVDLVAGKIIFTQTPNTDTLAYDFDYLYQPVALTLTTSPVFPAEYHDMIYQGMAVDSTIINLFDRAKSYAKENQAGYDSMMSKLRYYNSQLLND